MRRCDFFRRSVVGLVLCALVFCAGLEADESSSFARRRQQLMEAVKEGVILIPSQLKMWQNLVDNKNFIYLTGLQEPEALLSLSSEGEPRQMLFRRRTGEFPADPDLAQYPLERILPLLRTAARGQRGVIPFSDLGFLDRAFGPRHPFTRAEALWNSEPFIAPMRMVKDAEEIAYLREAVAVTSEGLNEAYRAAEPGMREIDLAAILNYTFARHSTESSFLQAASGPNATNVHFGATERTLKAADIIVFDVGAYHERYTSDISRTIPAGGRFTREQEDIYRLVLRAQKEGCRRLVPGVTFKAVQDAVEKILLNGLQDLGLVTDPSSPWQRRLYIQHGFGHFIGLDIHDVWSYHSPRLDEIQMAPGMVITMEPGLYFPEQRFETYLRSLKEKVPEKELQTFAEKVGPLYRKYIHIGVRIEDDVLITPEGNEVLSSGVPKEIAAIEKLMREKSPHNLIK